MQSNQEPHIGDKIYLPTSLYVTHGEDDFIGGICIISKAIKYGEDDAKEKGSSWRIEVLEDPGSFYSWDYLLELQDKLKVEFGDQRAYKRPDYREEFNRL